MTCAWCHAPLQARRPHTRTCSPRCRKAWQRHRAGPRSLRLVRELGVSPRDLWGTPIELFATLDTVFHFELDAAALPDDALCGRWLSPQQDALASPWGPCSGTVWCNPPYGRRQGGLLAWVRRIREQVAQWHLRVLLLVPAWDGPRWAQEAAAGACEKVVFTRRLAYRHPDTGKPMDNSNFPSCLYLFDFARSGPAQVRYVEPANVGTGWPGV